MAGRHTVTRLGGRAELAWLRHPSRLLRTRRQDAESARSSRLVVRHDRGRTSTERVTDAARPRLAQRGLLTRPPRAVLTKSLARQHGGWAGGPPPPPLSKQKGSGGKM